LTALYWRSRIHLLGSSRGFRPLMNINARFSTSNPSLKLGTPWDNHAA
jgi:hypothetical protein